jgi:16S rRNA (guanine966-N2)-methyltransferase
MIRIISGSLKGQYIKTSRKNPYRPLTASLRKSFFDYLNDYIKNKIFLDAFAGSGIIGFEAFSRGASYIIFVDSDKNAINLINANIKNLKILNAKALNQKIENIISKNLINPLPIDIIFLDPPFSYPKVKLEALITQIITSNILNLNSIINIHYSKHHGKLFYNPTALKLVKEFANSEAYLDVLAVK